MNDAEDTIRESIRELEDEHGYDADMGAVGDEDGKILTAYIPDESLDECRRLAAEVGAGFTLSHHVEETEEAVVSFEFGNAKR